jgi:thermitase
MKARRYLAVLLIAALLLATGCFGLIAVASPPAHAYAHGSYKANEVIIKLNPASGATIDAINATYGTTTLGPLGSLVGVYRLQAPPGQDAAALAATMATDARLLYAHPNYLREPPEANPRSSRAWGGLDPTPYNTHYARAMLGLTSAHAVTQGDGVIVAVLDTGVYLNHPALVSKLTAERYDFVDDDAWPDDVGNGLDDDGDGEADEVVGHGTHVAGIVLMVAPNARIMPLRVLDSDGIGDDGIIVQAIEYAITHGARVINLSLGTADESDLLEEAVERATRAGAVVVSASGNANSKTRQYPAAEGCVIAVTSVNQSDVKSSFSNYGSWVDIAAPGEAIYSMLENDGYGSWSGTSMAAPFVSGQAALIRRLRPDWNPWQISAAIARTSRDIRANNPGFGSDLGEGRIDVAASVVFAQSAAQPPTDDALISSSCVEPESPAGSPTPTPTPGATLTPTPTPGPMLHKRVHLPFVVR